MDNIVKLERRALGGFGFSVIGGVDTHLPPMVCAIVQNGSAHLSGKICAGDVILEVNGRPITGLTTEEVVECIRDSPDELTLRLMKDSGAKERAKPFLRKFAVADPKIPLYQAKLHRTASAPHTCITENLVKSKYKNKSDSSPIMRRNTGIETRKEDLKVKKNLLAIDENPDGTKYHRLITYFPVDGNQPQTMEDFSALKHKEIKHKRFSGEDEYLSGEISTSASSLPKNCPSCGGGMLVSSTPGLHEGNSRQKPGSPTKLRCRKCGKSLHVTLSNSSLPEKSGPSSRTFESSPIKPSSSLPSNATLGIQRKGVDQLDNSEDTRTRIEQSEENELKIDNGSVGQPSKGLTGSSSEASVASESQLQVEREKAGEMAIKLYRLEGFTKDEVAAELSKNTRFGKTVAQEYLKLFDFTDMTLTEALRKFFKYVLLIGETQERERILIPFSERYYECNKPEYGSSDAVHTLICAILLLNTDLHGENISKKMALTSFLENMTGLCDGGDFPKELLKSIYQEIKESPFEWSGEIPPRSAPGTPKPSRNVNGIRASPGNPFLEIQCDENDKVYREGLVYRKVTMESEGKKTSAWKRKWMPFYATLKGLILFLHKSDEISHLENTRNCLGIHHCFASRAMDYTKKQFVFRLVTADWREFLFQAKNHNDMAGWIDMLNLVAATFSSPPLPAPVGSSKRFQRPVLPFSKTRLTLAKQIEHHEQKAKESQDSLIACLQNQPREGMSRYLQDWQEKRDFLEYEYKRYMSYVTALRGSKLESKIRDKPKGEARVCASCDW
ncbi:PH and SEC7 domain-containing protein 1-like isoform X2 [Actinia tenebrosa]|uniref:PH and SEC7 domain-containing protein 1-like isoform X2 n=1 Tax=Actinia tenebrosa TaxID=6105 RepID=A0A6P8IP96_ACTTE|nr:PH and SEC7 domain-containing protein 1-like isoform X2 [Actinia tenebrosa]